MRLAIAGKSKEPYLNVSDPDNVDKLSLDTFYPLYHIVYMLTAIETEARQWDIFLK